MSVSPHFPIPQISPWPCLPWSTGLKQLNPQLPLDLTSRLHPPQSLCPSALTGVHLRRAPAHLTGLRRSSSTTQPMTSDQ